MSQHVTRPITSSRLICASPGQIIRLQAHPEKSTTSLGCNCSRPTNATVLPELVNDHGTNYFQVTFVHRPAESGVTHHVQSSPDLGAWTDIATYTGSNSVLSANAVEVSCIGSTNQCVTVRETTGA